MKIGIICNSKTGNTESIAVKLKENLNKKGYEVNLDRVIPESWEADPNFVTFKNTPDPEPYDLLIFCAPVQAFSLNRYMQKYMKNYIPSLPGKKTFCFVTQNLNHKWLGSSRAIKIMSGICKANGMEVIETGIIQWSKPDREQMVEELVSRFSEKISSL